MSLQGMPTRVESWSISERTGLPFISIIVPCRNEKRFIGKCLDSIIASDYPKDRREILVVDGMSEDGTREILEEYRRRYPFVQVHANPKRITPVALNIGIRHARGDLIMIMSAHATLAPNAISLCAIHSAEYGAENVGGVWRIRPRADSLMGKAICWSLAHKFGVGDATYRTITRADSQPRWVDTVAYGCYRREVFEKIGLFNENLTHSQDIELNIRLKRSGGRILLVPDMQINYYSHSDYLSFVRHNFRNGLWAILPFAYSEVRPVSVRHLVPLLFVTGLLASGLLSLWANPLRWLFLAILAAYAFANLAASLHIAWRGRDPRYFAVMPLAFASLHVAYGLGSCWGVAKLASVPEFWRKIFRLGGQHGAKNGRQES